MVSCESFSDRPHDAIRHGPTRPRPITTGAPVQSGRDPGSEAVQSSLAPPPPESTHGQIGEMRSDCANGAGKEQLWVTGSDDTSSKQG